MTRRRSGTGFWANKNGNAIIAAGGSTDGVCDAGAYLRGYAPFSDLSATATCDQLARYAAAVVKAASCAGSTCNTMLKAQMLITALGLFFRDPRCRPRTSTCPRRVRRSVARAT